MCFADTPNYYKIYAFLGSLLDPSPPNHVDMLHELSPIDREVIQLLIHNLMLSLSTPEFREAHMPLMEQYHALKYKQPIHSVSARDSLGLICQVCWR
jgi:hypothetical protein